MKELINQMTIKEKSKMRSICEKSCCPLLHPTNKTNKNRNTILSLKVIGAQCRKGYAFVTLLRSLLSTIHKSQ